MDVTIAAESTLSLTRKVVGLSSEIGLESISRAVRLGPDLAASIACGSISNRMHRIVIFHENFLNMS